MSRLPVCNMRPDEKMTRRRYWKTYHHSTKNDAKDNTKFKQKITKKMVFVS